MAEVAKTAARQLPAFKLGKNRVFLPEHVLIFLRKDHLPPNEACFQVPLRWTKFDLRDYLWNLYDVEVKKVRSYVKEMPLARRPGAAQGWYRPQSKKIMTVELAKPFQWPEMPTDLEPWNKELFDRREEKMDEQRKLQKERHDMTLPMKSRQPLTETRKELAKLAKKMVSGEVEWRNDVTLDPKWDKILEEALGKNGLKGSKKSGPKEVQEELTR